MIVILSGTNRPGSFTRRVARNVDALYSALKVEHRILDLAQLPREIFDPASYAQRPASFRPFSQAILDSQGVVIVTPEYNGGMPGILKYFIDMLKFPESFERRPVCFVGLSAGMWGALRPVEQLQAIFGYRNAYIYPERVFLPRIDGQVDDSGAFTDPEVVERLKKQAQGFLEFVKRLQEHRGRAES